ncbi:MAG: hypothetical protein V4475_21330 [Pseudomonadota bacterium]
MWSWIKIPKGIALAAFFLPWVTVSCSQQKLISASGWQLATGRVSFFGDAAQANNNHPNIYIALALISVIAGLVLSFGPARRTLWTLATSLAGLLLIWLGTRDLTGQSIAQRAAEQRHETLDAAVASVIRVEWQWGYWLTNIALIVAAVLAWMAMTGRRVSVRSDRDAPNS